MRTYEGMFLLDAGQPNIEQAVEPIRAVLTRNGAEILHLKKWDERRLAFEIQGRRRGLYILAYFKAEPARIAEIEHDVKLNEQILRMLVLAADHVSAEKMAAPTPAETGETGRDEEREESDDRDDRPRRPRRFRDEMEVPAEISEE